MFHSIHLLRRDPGVDVVTHVVNKIVDLVIMSDPFLSISTPIILPSATEVNSFLNFFSSVCLLIFFSNNV